MGERMSLWPLWICHTPKAALPGWDWQTNYPHGRFVDSGKRENSKAHLTHSVGLLRFSLSILERAEEQKGVGYFTASLRAKPLQPSHVSMAVILPWSPPLASLLIAPPGSNPKLHGQVRDHLIIADVSLFALYKEGFCLWCSSEQSSSNR